MIAGMIAWRASIAGSTVFFRMPIYPRLETAMTLDKEKIADLQREIFKLRAQLIKRDGNIVVLQEKILELEKQIEGLKSQRDFFLDQANINLAENRRLWDRLRKNPYSDDYYNEQ